MLTDLKKLMQNGSLYLKNETLVVSLNSLFI